MTAFAELVAATNFSFLRGASHAHEMVGRAAELGLAPSASPTAIRWPAWCAPIGRPRSTTSAAWSARRPARSPPTASRRSAIPPTARPTGGCAACSPPATGAPIKGQCEFTFEEMVAASEGQILIAIPPRQLTPVFSERLRALAAAAPGRIYLAAVFAYDGNERRRLGELAALAGEMRTPLVATNDVIYHHPDRKPLADVLACIREKCTIRRRRLPPRGQRRAPPEARRRDGAPVRALSRRRSPARSRSPAASSSDLDELRYEYPDEPVPPGKTPQAYLEELTWAQARRALSRRRAGQGARASRQGAGADRQARLRALFPHRLRRRALRPQPGHPVPGPRLGRQQRGVLLPRHHRRRSHRDRPAVRALHLRRPRRAARHRRRFRARAARGGDPVSLRPLRPRARRHLRHRHPLPPAHGHPRGGQGHGPEGGRDGGARRA